MSAITKIIFVGALLLGLNWIAQHRPGLAGWIAAAPVVSLISLFLLILEGADNQKQIAFMNSVLFGQIPNVVFLVAFVLLLQRGVSIATALAVGAVIWLVGTYLAQRTGLL